MASASDNFNRANGDVGANWTLVHGDDSPAVLQVVSNQVESGLGVYREMRYTATGPATANHSVTMTYRAGTEGVLNMLVRHVDTGANRDCYVGLVQTFNGEAAIIEMTNGAEVTLTSAAESFTAGDTFTIECNGTSLVLKKNGIQILSTTDGSLVAAGGWGIGIYQSGFAWDDFTATDLAVAGHPARRRFGVKPFGVSGLRIH